MRRIVALAIAASSLVLAGAPAPADETAAVVTVNYTYLPGDDTRREVPLQVARGDDIRFANLEVADDRPPHTITYVGCLPNTPDDPCYFNTGNVTSGQTKTVNTSDLSPRVYRFLCLVHPVMKGRLTVTS